MLEPKVIYENDNFLAIDKPAGLMVHAAKISSKHRKKNDGPIKEPTVVDWLLENYPGVKTVGDEPALRPGIVHRLDRATSGVMLIAKTQEYFDYLKSLFQKHEVRKTYYAVVIGVPKNKEGTIDAPIGIRTGTLKRSVRSTKMQKEAVTAYKVIKSYTLEGASQEVSLLEVTPKTGRTHQIRVHLASIAHPIIGDPLYGSKTSHGLAPRLMLHAAAIEFLEKNGSMVRLDAYPQPKDFPI
jgi:23S rRNA pseudouridine1911/1915/1917 synthase